LDPETAWEPFVGAVDVGIVEGTNAGAERLMEWSGSEGISEHRGGFG
jgi:hypothetical protein